MFYQGPITYEGNKRRLMPQIKPLLADTHVFVDLFAGSGTVGLNAPAEKVVFNDTNKPLMDLLAYLKSTDPEVAISKVDELTVRFGLTDPYHSPDYEGRLQDLNKSGYIKLREYYNENPTPGVLLALLQYSFNNQMRWNKSGKFNMPVGSKGFNANQREKVREFHKRAQEVDAVFSSKDFNDWKHFSVKQSTLFYADPPYLVSTATYNTGWDESNESNLLDFLDYKHENGDKFALSNVLELKGQENNVLTGWIDSRPEYTVHELEVSYGTANYHRKVRGDITREVFITNY